MPDVENVKVAVRVRPFNKREIDRKSKLCVSMSGKSTTVTDPSTDKPRSFTYDFSYWSHDGGKEDKSGYIKQDPNHPNGKKYSDQNIVFKDLGLGILKNAWAGYNATLFAYGQTGSGKSWSVIGYGANKGIVPLVCEELFNGIRANKEAKQFEVKFSMMEIYNEVARDLLSNSAKKQGLKIRQHPKKGFYAEGLRTPLVSSNEDITSKMEEGTVNRTIRSTNMNATSSRAHTIVAVTFIQKFVNERNQETAKTAVINLVDLAGSERVESTGATGDRLKEGAAINLSLTSLGNVINALVKQGNGESVRIPYRDSTLTKLLKNALGGNSKTIMVAAISPADINYDETVSTLNFADRAKQIKTTATVNEDPTEKLIRELKEENERLKKNMKSGKIDANFVDDDGDGIDDRDAEKLKKKWEEEMKARMMENEAEMLNMKKTYEEKLKTSKKDVVDPSIKKKEEEKLRKPHISNLNSDPMLSGKVIHILRGGTTTIGNRRGQESDITMLGPSMQENHATISVDKNNVVSVKPVSSTCRVLINGNPIQARTPLVHNDRVVFGSTQIWVFQDPTDKKNASKNVPPITYEYAQEEIASKNGLNLNELDGSSASVALQHEMTELMPLIHEANSISEELDRKAKFEMFIHTPQLMGKTSGKQEVRVKLRNLANGTEFIWTKDKFLDRYYQMKEMFEKYEDEDDEWDVDQESCPFKESLDTEVTIGTVQVSMQHAAHNVELNEQLEIVNHKGAEVGLMNIEVAPCSRSGREYSEKDDAHVDNPDDLVGREVHFKFKIHNCRGLPNRYAGIFCSYTMYLEKEEVRTNAISDTTNPNYKHVKQFSFKRVTKQLIDFLVNTPVVVNVIGKQRVRGSAIANVSSMTTKELMKNDQSIFSQTAHLMGGFQMNGRVVDPQRQSIIVELLLMKKTQAKLQQRLDNVVKLIKEAENTSRLRVSTTLLREVMNANSNEKADALIRKKLSGESDYDNDGSSSSQKSQVCTLL